MFQTVNVFDSMKQSAAWDIKVLCYRVIQSFAE